MPIETLYNRFDFYDSYEFIFIFSCYVYFSLGTNNFQSLIMSLKLYMQLSTLSCTMIESAHPYENNMDVVTGIFMIENEYS